MLSGPCRLGELRGEPLDPPVDAHVIDLHPALGEKLLDVSVGKAEPQVPPDGQGDDLRREPVSGEGRTWGWPRVGVSVRSHRASLSDGSPRDQCNSAPIGSGVIATANGVGMLLSSLALIRWGPRGIAATLFSGGWVLSGLGILGTGLAPAVGVAVAAQAVAGAGNGVENVAGDTLLQTTVPRLMRPGVRSGGRNRVLCGYHHLPPGGLCPRPHLSEDRPPHWRSRDPVHGADPEHDDAWKKFNRVSISRNDGFPVLIWEREASKP